jgi:hypothetical protein
MAAAACANAGPGGDEPTTDAPVAQPDSNNCALQTYYRDADGDGHGTAASPMQACQQPAGTVTSKDDCDDTNPQRYPGLAEICDGFDNDCSAATQEVCPAGCTPRRRPPPDDTAHAYLVCNVLTTWSNAATTCANATYKLVEIEDMAENTAVRNLANEISTGVDIWLGGTDAVTEGTWLWPSGTQFWLGGSAGMPVGGKFSNWNGGEPNNDLGEDCTEMYGTGKWNDLSCSDTRRFLCRK